MYSVQGIVHCSAHHTVYTTVHSTQCTVYTAHSSAQCTHPSVWPPKSVLGQRLPGSTGARLAYQGPGNTWRKSYIFCTENYSYLQKTMGKPWDEIQTVSCHAQTCPAWRSRDISGHTKIAKVFVWPSTNDYVRGAYSLETFQWPSAISNQSFRWPQLRLKWQSGVLRSCDSLDFIRIKKLPIFFMWPYPDVWI